jgi:membrane-bound serine protease (ClpP class)
MMWVLVVALLALGMVLLVAEIAIIPGFGVAGISSIVLLAAGVGLAWYSYGAAWGIGSLVLATGLAVAVVVIAPRTRAGKALVLQSSITAQHPDQTLERLVGQAGKALTDLRPAGAVEIDGRRVDVVTDGKFVAAGSAVRVASVEGARVVVEEAQTKG